MPTLENSNPYNPENSNQNDNNRSLIAEAINPEALPIEAEKPSIMEMIGQNQISIITAETGAGKSTQVPQWLLEEGYEVIVTQPRRLAARSLAQRVAEEQNCRLGKKVGFRTGEDRNDSPETDLLFCTDGLQLVRELTGDGVKGKKIALVLDEVHEWNINMEVLLAWAKKQIKSGAEFKLIIMSATLESDKLATYFSENEKKAPVAEVKGRNYPVEEREPTRGSISETALDLVKEGRNILIFQPGKAEISKTISEINQLLEAQKIRAEVLPLHGQLEPEEQKKVFTHYPIPKIIVSTNVAQTSVTIDDIDAVIDSGLERRVETRDGVEGLYEANISQADCEQRKGRAGRCKPGIYVLCAKTPLEKRDAFPTPEIQRERLDQMVLRLSRSGLDATDLEFFHQPDPKALRLAKETLTLLGALDNQGKCTPIGEKMSRLPVSIQLARMIVEAEKNHCVDKVLTIAACLESGGLRARVGKYETPAYLNLTQERESDPIAELEIFEKILSTKMTKEQMRENGIFIKSYFRSLNLRKKLFNAIRSSGIKLKNGQEGDREAIIRSIVSGMLDRLYVSRGYGSYSRSQDENTREIGRESVLKYGDTSSQLIVADPFDISLTGRRGQFTLELLTNVTAVTPEILEEVAPHLIQKTLEPAHWANLYQEVRQNQIVSFAGNQITNTSRLAEKTEQSFQQFLQAIIQRKVSSETMQEIYAENYRVRQELKELFILSQGKTPTPPSNLSPEEILSAFRNHTPITSRELENLFNSSEINPNSLTLKQEEYISPQEAEKIRQENPTQLHINGKELIVNYKNPSEDSFTIQIIIESEDIYSLRDHDFSAHFPGQREITFLTIHRYSSLEAPTLRQLKAKIRTIEEKISWNEFLNNAEKKSYTTEEIIQAFGTTQPQIYYQDEEERLFAYPFFQFHQDYYRTPTFSLDWEKDPQIAEEINSESQKIIEKLKKITELEERYQQLDYPSGGIYYRNYENLRLELTHLQENIKTSSEEEINEAEKNITDLEKKQAQEEQRRLEEEAEEAERIRLEEEAEEEDEAYQEEPNTTSAPYNPGPTTWIFDGPINLEPEEKNSPSPQKNQPKEEEIIFTPLPEMTEEEIESEYEENEQEIEYIKSTHPTIEELETIIQQMEEEMEEEEKKLNSLQTQGPGIGEKSRKKFENKKKKLREKIKTIRIQLREKRSLRTQDSEKIFKKLKAYQARQEEIEQYIC